MTVHPKRGRITILPLDCALHRQWWRSGVEGLSRHPLWQPEALIVGGLLIRHKQSGRLAKYAGDHIETIDERKAEAALAAFDGPCDDPD